MPSSRLVPNAHDVTEVGHEVGTALTGLRSTLAARFGHAVLDVAVDIDPRRRVVNLTGLVASAPTAVRAVAASSVAAPGWRVDGRALAEIRTDDWRTLPAGVTPVSVSPAGPTLSTELVRADGPVEVLARLGASHLHPYGSRDARLGKPAPRR